VATKKKTALPSVKSKLAPLAKKAAAKAGSKSKTLETKAVSASAKASAKAKAPSAAKSAPSVKSAAKAKAVAPAKTDQKAKATAVASKTKASAKAAAPAKVPAPVKEAAKAKALAPVKVKAPFKEAAAEKVKKETFPEITLTPFDWYAAAKERFSVARKRESLGYVSAERFARLNVEADEA